MWKGILIFLTGAATGGAGSALFMKQKHEKEIEQIRETYRKSYAENMKKVDGITMTPISETIEDSVKNDITEECNKTDTCVFENKVQKPNKVNYSGYSSKSVVEASEEIVQTKRAQKKRPYVITEAEFESNDAYEKVYCTKYADGVVTDEYDTPIENPDNELGIKNLQSDADTIYIRNDKLRIDYEVSIDINNYYDNHASESDTK